MLLELSKWLILYRERIIFGRKRQCTRQTCKGEAEKCSCDKEEIGDRPPFTVLDQHELLHTGLVLVKDLIYTQDHHS